MSEDLQAAARDRGGAASTDGALPAGIGWAGGSEAERAIRCATVARLRDMLPGARIVHELVVGGCRADLAAIEPERLTLVEIKSERDTLGRLASQVREFSEASHQLIVVAHERWFDRTPYSNGSPRFVPSDDLREGVGVRGEIWAYPDVPERPMYGPWQFSQWPAELPEPRASSLLGLLWKAELLAEAQRHRISVTTRWPVRRIIREMVWLMTGREIAAAVCRQLRSRHFPVADAPLDQGAEIPA